MDSVPQPADAREIRQTALDILHRSLDDAGGTLKLVLSLSTGAAVLLVNVLAGRGLPRDAVWLSAVSVLFFGAAAVLCLNLLVGLASLRSIMCNALIDQSSGWPQALHAKLDRWKKDATATVKFLAVLFGLGLAFAAAAVTATAAAR